MGTSAGSCECALFSRRSATHSLYGAYLQLHVWFLLRCRRCMSRTILAGVLQAAVLQIGGACCSMFHRHLSGWCRCAQTETSRAVCCVLLRILTRACGQVFLRFQTSPLRIRVDASVIYARSLHPRASDASAQEAGGAQRPSSRLSYAPTSACQPLRLRGSVKSGAVACSHKRASDQWAQHLDTSACAHCFSLHHSQRLLRGRVSCTTGWQHHCWKGRS